MNKKIAKNKCTDKIIDGRQKVLEKINEFCLFDDDFMSRVFEQNIECTELILRIILDNPNIKVKKVQTQREIKNLLGHSVRLDIDALDEKGRPFDVEIQRRDKGAGVKRARYNSSLMDANTLVKGEDYDALPESYVIFVTENDVMGEGYPIYHADRMVAETGNPLGDGTHIIYVNGAYRDDSSIGRLMHDFSCKSYKDMNYKTLAEQVRYYKEDAEGVATMCKIVEDLLNDEKKEAALRLLKMGKITKEEIAEALELPMEIIEDLALQLSK